MAKQSAELDVATPKLANGNKEASFNTPAFANED
jgi:hypothetical protein